MALLRHRCLSLSLVLVALLLPLMLSVTTAFAADDVDRLRSQIEKDQAAFNRVVKAVNDAPLNTRSDAVALAGTLDGAASDFDASAQNYRSLAKNSSIAAIANSAGQGASDIAAGARSGAAALRNGDGTGFQTAQSRMNTGGQSLSRAVDQYNAYIKAHPSGSSVFGGLGESPLELTVSSAPFVLGIGLYLLLAGFILNALFRSRVKRLTSGADRRLRGGILAAVYGIHLLLLVALAYAALAFAAVLVVDFGLLAADGVLHASRIPIMLVVALAAVVLASLWGILKGLFSSAKSGNYGVEVDAREEPGLWSLSRETASAVGTRPADAILVSPLPGISVHEEGGLLQLLFGRTRRVLTVGAPSILGLTVQQFQAILGHEYGHFSNRDTAWSSLTYRAGSAISQTLGTMQSVEAQGGWFAMVSFINPARWTLWLYRLLFAYMTSGFSRMREVYADQGAVARYGAEPFKGGLRGVVVNDQLFAGAIMPHLLGLVREGKYLTNVYAAADGARQGLAADEAERMFSEAAAQKRSAFDSHPSLPNRLAYADRFGIGSESRGMGGTELLVERFADWGSRSTQLSDLLTHTLFAAAGAPPAAAPAAHTT